VVVAIVAVLATLALPSMQQMLRRHQVRVVAEDLLADLQWARAEAVRHGMSVAMHFDEPATGWQIFLSPDDACASVAGQVALRTYRLPSSVVLPSVSPAHFCFDPQDTMTKKMGRVYVRPLGGTESDPANRALCQGLAGRIRIEAGATCQE